MPEHDDQKVGDRVRRSQREWNWRDRSYEISGTHQASRFSEDMDPNDDPIDHDPLGRRETEFAPEDEVQSIDQLFK